MRCSFNSAKHTHKLLSVMAAGEHISISDAMEITGVKYAQAREYLCLLEEAWALQTRRDSRIKRWFWTYKPLEEVRDACES
jgi:predicted transcriptional regulator of viral defense system